MTDPEIEGLDVALVLRRFPEQAALVWRLVNESETFRSLCEEFTLAADTLVRLDGHEDGDRPAAVISDYTLLLGELEKEIASALGDAAAGG